MKDKIKKYLIVFSISLNIGFVIMAGYVMIRYRLPYGDHQAKHSSHISSFEKLELSDDQKKQIEELVKEYIRLSKRPHYSSIQETVKIYTLLKEPGQPSREALDEYLNAEQLSENEKEKIKLSHLLDIKRVLTEDQARSFFQNLAEIKQAHAIRQQQKP